MSYSPRFPMKRLALLALAPLALAACSGKETARADSAQAAYSSKFQMSMARSYPFRPSPKRSSITSRYSLSESLTTRTK